MASQEHLDIYDDNMTHLGTALRYEVHEKGHWHQTFQCWLIRRNDDGEYVLFQRRGPDKELFPDKFDITAAGHLIAGEAPVDGIRELNEELGLSTRVEDLVFLGIRCDVMIVGSVTNREFCHTYLLESNIPLDAYKLEAGEVTGLVQMEIGDGLRLFADDVETVPVSGYRVDANGAKHEIGMEVSKQDIAGRLDRYHLKVFIMAERYFQANTYLAI